jgi:hypothetical protein
MHAGPLLTWQAVVAAAIEEADQVPLSAVCCRLLLSICCLLSAYLLSIVCCLPPAIYYLLFAVCCLVAAVCWLLSSCLLSTAYVRFTICIYQYPVKQARI